MLSCLELPHAPRVVGVAFLLYLALGRLPALFALPAGLGDIAAGIAAPLVALRLAQGTGRRAALWFNAFGLTDLVTALALGAPHRIRVASRHPLQCPAHRTPARADTDSRGAAAHHPAHHVRVRARPGTAASVVSRSGGTARCLAEHSRYPMTAPGCGECSQASMSGGAIPVTRAW